MAAISLDIYHLIHRMNRTEKAYFKKFGYKYDKGAGKLESQLFDLIEKEIKKTTEIDSTIEEAVLAQAQKQLGIKSISKYKTNLFHDLLSALRDYEKSKVVDEKVFEYYQYAQILVKRNLFKEALAFMKKAENLAKENELFELEIYMAHHYAVLLSRLNLSKKGAESVQKLDDVLSSLKSLEEIFEMEKNYFELVNLQKTVGTMNSAEDLEFLALKWNTVNQIEFIGSTRGRLYQLESFSTIEILKGNQQESFEYYEQIIQLLDAHPHLKKTNLQKYIVLSEQYMQMSLLTMNISGFEGKHAVFIDIPCENELEQSWKDNADIFMLSIYAILAKKLDSFDVLEQRFSDLLDRIPYLVPGYRKISIAYYMVSGFFMRDDYERAMDWFHFIQNNRDLGVRHDVDVASRIMMLIACFEKEEFILMEHQLKAFRNFISSHSIYQLEGLVSSFFGKLLKAADKEKQDELYAVYLEKLTSHFETYPNERAFSGIFDLEAWLHAKQDREPFYEVWCRRHLAEQ